MPKRAVDHPDHGLNSFASIASCRSLNLYVLDRSSHSEQRKSQRLIEFSLHFQLSFRNKISFARSVKSSSNIFPLSSFKMPAYLVCLFSFHLFRSSLHVITIFLNYLRYKYSGTFFFHASGVISSWNHSSHCCMAVL